MCKHTDLPADDLCRDGGADDVRLAHVAHPEEQAQLAVAQAHDGVAREEQRLRALLGPRQLGKHNARHEALDHDACDGLHAQDEHGLRALGRDGAAAVANGVLRGTRPGREQRSPKEESKRRQHFPKKLTVLRGTRPGREQPELPT